MTFSKEFCQIILDKFENKPLFNYFINNIEEKIKLKKLVTKTSFDQIKDFSRSNNFDSDEWIKKMRTYFDEKKKLLRSGSVLHCILDDIITWFEKKVAFIPSSKEEYYSLKYEKIKMLGKELFSRRHIIL